MIPNIAGNRSYVHFHFVKWLSISKTTTTTSENADGIQEHVEMPRRWLAVYQTEAVPYHNHPVLVNSSKQASGVT